MTDEELRAIGDGLETAEHALGTDGRGPMVLRGVGYTLLRSTRLLLALVDALRAELADRERLVHDLSLDNQASHDAVRADERARVVQALLSAMPKAGEAWFWFNEAAGMVGKLGPAEPLPPARLRARAERAEAALREIAECRMGEATLQRIARGALEGP